MPRLFTATEGNGLAAGKRGVGERVKRLQNALQKLPGVKPRDRNTHFFVGFYLRAIPGQISKALQPYHFRFRYVGKWGRGTIFEYYPF